MFAPTDDAFAVVESATSTLTTEQIKEILLDHVVSGEVDAAAVVGLTSATTVQGEEITVDASSGTAVLNGGSNVVATDVIASNGIVHVIDAVTLPPSFQ